MSFSIEGWVEVSRLKGKEQQDKFAWSGVIKLNLLIDTYDDFSERFFGLSKQYVSGEKRIDPIFAHRGIPSNPSQEVQAEINAITKHELQYGASEYGGYTYVLWGELKNTPHFNIPKDSDWNTLANLIYHLEKDYRFTDNQIRIVTWFNW